MTKELQTLLIQIAKASLEHKECSDVIARELGLSEQELDDLYERLSNQII